MNWLTIGFGLLAIIFGIVMFYLRAGRLEKFGAGGPIKQRAGRRAGYTVYLFAYSIIPVVFGIILIVAGVRGYAIF